MGGEGGGVGGIYGMISVHRSFSTNLQKTSVLVSSNCPILVICQFTGHTDFYLGLWCSICFGVERELNLLGFGLFGSGFFASLSIYSSVRGETHLENPHTKQVTLNYCNVLPSAGMTNNQKGLKVIVTKIFSMWKYFVKLQ